MSQRSKQKAESFNVISKTAARLVRERGFEGTSVQEVMAGAGLTVGAFYAHFKDKDEMVQRGLDLALDDVRALVEEASRNKTGSEALASVAKRYLKHEHRDQPELGCPLPATLGQAAAKTSTAKQRKILSSAVEEMATRLSNASCNSLPQEEILTVLATIVGAQIIARATRGNEISSHILESCSQHFAKNTKE